MDILLFIKNRHIFRANETFYIITHYDVYNHYEKSRKKTQILTMIEKFKNCFKNSSDRRKNTPSIEPIDRPLSQRAVFPKPRMVRAERAGQKNPSG